MLLWHMIRRKIAPDCAKRQIDCCEPALARESSSNAWKHVRHCRRATMAPTRLPGVRAELAPLWRNRFQEGAKAGLALISADIDANILRYAMAI